MNQHLDVLAASVTTFAATNIDDAILLTLFFARRVPVRRVVAGQYLGFAAIVVASLLGARAALTIPYQWIRFLGFLPILIGIRYLFKSGRGKSEGLPDRDFGIVSIALLTLSNGADNIGIYLPFFVVGRAHIGLILVMYGALVAVWCLLGWWLGNHAFMIRFADRWASRTVAVVFILLGTYILYSR